MNTALSVTSASASTTTGDQEAAVTSMDAVFFVSECHESKEEQAGVAPETEQTTFQPGQITAFEEFCKESLRCFKVSLYSVLSSSSQMAGV